MKTETKFTHRDMTNEEGVSPVDLYRAIAEPINGIQTFVQLLDSNTPILLDDDISRDLLRQIELNALDVLSVAEGFADSFDFCAVIGESVTDKEAFLEFLTETFEATYKKKVIDKKDSDMVPSLAEVGSCFAENILNEFSQAEYMKNLEKIASTYSKSIAKYTSQLSDIGNEELLEALLMKFLVAGVPNAEEEPKSFEVEAV